MRPDRTSAARAATILTAVAALGLAGPGSPAAAERPTYTHPPKFRSNRIVEGVSIGGLKVGMQKSQAIAAWGKPDGKCRRVNPYDPDDRRRECQYAGFTRTKRGIESGYPPAGFTHLPSGKVTGVHIGLPARVSGDKSLERKYNMAVRLVGPLKTSKRIGLRSTMQAARDAYGIPTPTTKLEDYNSKDFLGSVIVRQANACTVFSSSNSRPFFKYVDGISVNAAEWCPKDPEPPRTQS